MLGAYVGQQPRAVAPRACGALHTSGNLAVGSGSSIIFHGSGRHVAISASTAPVLLNFLTYGEPHRPDGMVGLGQPMGSVHDQTWCAALDMVHRIGPGMQV